MVEKVAEYTAMPEFDPDLVKKGSIAAAGLCKWVHAMIVYDRVAKNVAPKKAALKEVMDKLTSLNDELAAAQKKKTDLQTQVTDCATNLRRAEQLINGLGGEKARWTELSKELAARYANLTG